MNLPDSFQPFVPGEKVIPARDYAASDGHKIWIAFKSNASGGWWTLDQHGSFHADDSVKFYVPSPTQ